MTLGEIIKFIDNWARQFEQRLSELVEGLDIRVQGMQRDVM